jgi:IS5 family transposase
MFIIPDFVPIVIATCWTQLIEWFSDQVYAELLKKAPDHLLVKLKAHLDFTPLEKACASYHHTTGPGAKPTHPVPRLVRAQVVMYLFNWSLRQIEWHIRFNLIVKWFVGYPIFAAGPDHTTIERFDLWVCQHQHRAIFDEVLRQIDADFPEERLKPQIGDTYALQANAAKESLVRLIRHTCQRLLTALATANPARHTQVEAQLDHTALFGSPDEPTEYRLTAAERAARLQTTVLTALDCAALVQTALEQPVPLCLEAAAPVNVWLNCLHKIIQDEVQLSLDSDGNITQVTQRTTHAKGAYRIGSATDTEATYRVHGKDKSDLGYNVSVAATDNFVREAQADTGAQPDPVAIPELITAQKEHHNLIPLKFIYDAAAGTGKTHAEVNQASDDQTQLVAPLIDYDKSSERFSPQDFHLSDDGLILTCPNGQSSSIAYRSGSGDGRMFRFFGRQCRDCPLWEKCRTHKPGSRAIRHVFISDYRAEYEAALAYSQTEDFKLDMQLRPQVERVIAGIVRYNGGRRARRRGQDNADFQAKMNATAYNIKRWIRLLTLKSQPAKIPA